MISPLVSILIPAHNSEEWVADSIRSAIAQTWQRKEIIIVDDGSSDKTGQIARQFCSKEVTVVSTDRRGAAAARNEASATETIFSGWMPMIYYRRTKLSGSLRPCGELMVVGYCYLRRGATSTTGLTASASFQLRSGTIFCRWNG